MKYMLLIYDNATSRQTLSAEGGEAIMAEVDALMQELTRRGELVGGEALADPSNTKTVRARDGVPAFTDGPLAEAKEHFGGHLIVDCESPDGPPRSPPGGRTRASRRWGCGRSWMRPGPRCEPGTRGRGAAAPPRAAGSRRAGSSLP